ncbi:6487_t:CDS:2 [Acaulospora colombiana]|uniref:6487_t:CDS:1 n=1 Tax=Acaulospora colombiana TaxID=27376 RepID=A0ACA9KGS3_9GLOM|nr:6487_t:CDS:2 [Acaulospora colombiana]
MAATIHLNSQQPLPLHQQHQHVQHQSERNRPISTPVPMSVPRYPEIPHPPPAPQSSVRRGNMFGPYLLLQTLGEGEFGKVKLGIHVDTGEEAAANPVPSLAPPEAYLPSEIPVSNNYLTTDYTGDRQNVPSGTSTVKRHTIQVEYSDNNAKYVDYPDEDFQFVDGTRLGPSLSPVATSDMILQEERDELLRTDYENTSSLPSQNLDLPETHSKTGKHHSITPTVSSGHSDRSSTAASTPSTITTRTSTNAGSSLLTLHEKDTDEVAREKNQSNDVYHNLDAKNLKSEIRPMESQQKNSSQTPKKRDAPRTRPVTVHGPPSIPLIQHRQNETIINPSVPSKNSTLSDNGHQRPENILPSSQYSSPPPSIPLPPIPGHRESPIPAIPPPSVIQKRHKRSPSSEKLHSSMGIKNESGNPLVTVSTASNYEVESRKQSISQSQTLQPGHFQTTLLTTDVPSDTASDTTSYVDENLVDETKKGRNGKRKALSLMVDTFKGPAAHSTHSVVSNGNVAVKEKRKTVSGTSAGSSNAAKKVMDWFRRKSLAKPDIPSLEVPNKLARVDESVISTNSELDAPQKNKKKQKSNPSVVVTQLGGSQSSSRQSTMTSTSAVDLKLRVHHGAVDQDALTSRPPYEVFIVVKQTLVSMGIEIKRESEFKVRCVRRKRKQIENGKSKDNKSQKNKDNSQASENSENGVDSSIEKKRRKYTTSPLKTFLRRTNSNNTSTTSSGITPISSQNNFKSPEEMNAVDNDNALNGDSFSIPNSPTMGPLMTLTGPDDSSTANILPTSTLAPEILYGDPSIDSGEEIRFAVELCRLKNLPGIYIVDIKRMKALHTVPGYNQSRRKVN